MAIDKSMGASELADILKSEIRSIVQEGQEAGDDFAEAFIKSATNGVKKHSKELKSEIAQMFEDFNRITNNFKSRKTISNSEWTKVLGMSKELLKSERYADSVQEKLDGIAVTMKGIGKVSGLINVLKELEKAGDKLESVQWSEAGKNYKKKSTTNKSRANSKPVVADPTQVVKDEISKKNAVNDTNKVIDQNTVKLKEQAKAEEKVADSIQRTAAEQKKLNDLNKSSKNQKDWLKYLDESLDKSNFKTSGKREASAKLRSATNYLITQRKESYKNAYGEFAKEMAEVAWMHAYQEAERQGVAQSTLDRYDTDARYSYEKNLKVLQDERNLRQGILNNVQKEIDLIDKKTEAQKEFNTTQKNESNIQQDDIVVKNNNAVDAAKEQLSVQQQITDEQQKQNKLIAMHGISTQNLIKSLKDGAFPSPSIALTRPDIYDGGYGDATVVFKRSAIDPSLNSNNKIYGVDAYTPTYPNFGFELNEDALKVAAEKTGVELDALRTVLGGAHETIEDALGHLAFKAFSVSDQVKDSYLKDRRIKIEPTYEDEATIGRFHVNGDNIYNSVQDILKREGITFDMVVNDDKTQKEYFDAIDKYVADYNSQFYDFPQAKIKDTVVDAFKETIRLAKTDQAVYDEEKAIFDHDQAVLRGERKIVDNADYFDKRSKVISDNRVDYINYVKSVFEEALVKPFVRGIDGQTFDRTPDGIAEAMASYGGKNALYNQNPFMRKDMDDQIFIIGAAKNYKSVAEAEADAARLAKDAPGGHTKLDNGDIESIARTIAQANNIEAQDAFDKIAQAVDGNTTADAIGKALRDSGLAVDDATVDKLVVAAQEAANVQTRYFEAKPQRALSTEDIAFVSLPKGTYKSDTIKEMLDAQGIPYVDHDLDDKGSREAALIEGMQKYDVVGSAAYENLIANENKYQQEIEETNKIQKERQAQVDAYTEAASNLLSAGYDSISPEDQTKLFVDFGNKIMQEGMSASDAIDQLYMSLEALRQQSESMPDDIIGDFGKDNIQVAETISQLQKLSSIDLTRIFDSVDLKSFLESFNIDQSNFAIFRNLFEELMQITKAMGDGVDVGNAFDSKMEEITNTIMRLGGHMEDVGDSTLQDFYKHMRGTKVQFNDTIKGDYTKDQWKSLYGTYKNRLTSDVTKGISADSLYHELSGLWPHLFPEGVLSQQDQFKLIFEKLDEARKLQANNWKTLQGFASGDRNGIQGNVDDIYNKMTDALYAEANAANDVEQSMDKAASAKDKFTNANKQVGDSANASTSQLGSESDALDAVYTSAEKIPDGDVVTRIFLGDNEDPSAAIIKNVERIGSKIQTTVNKLVANEGGGWDTASTSITDKNLIGMQEYVRAYTQEAKKLKNIEASIRAVGEDNMGADFAAKVKTYTNALKDMDIYMRALQDNPNDASISKQFDDAALKAKNARTEVEGILKESQKLQKIGSLVATDDQDVSKLQNIKGAMVEFANSAFDGQVKITGFNKEGTQMYATITQAGGAVENITVALNGATGKLQAFSTGTSKATNEWEDFKTQVAAGTKQLVGMYVGFQEGVQAVRSGLNYVKEIDLAMTELKKVTDETDASYKQFLKDAGSTASVIGSTVSDFTEASATFARLGYSLEESSKMAETAIVYKNVADGLDSVEESSNSIISTMMAFGIEANDTMSIIDRFNAVGNSFAITSAGIGEALQRSASALYSAGNTIDESVALVTAANSVIQNPEQVGKMLADYKVA